MSVHVHTFDLSVQRRGHVLPATLAATVKMPGGPNELGPGAKQPYEVARDSGEAGDGGTCSMIEVNVCPPPAQVALARDWVKDTRRVYLDDFVRHVIGRASIVEAIGVVLKLGVNFRVHLPFFT